MDNLDPDTAPVSFTDFDAEEAKLVEMATSPMYKLDGQLHVKFYKHAELNSFESRLKGRKIYEERIYVRIQSPANRATVIECRATDAHKTRFARQYTQFLKGLTQIAKGTPLGELTTLSPAQILELNALNVETVEQLAEMPDSVTQILGTGGMELKLRAQRFLATHTTLDEQGSRIAKLEAELLAERKARAELEQKISEVRIIPGAVAPAAITTPPRAAAAAPK